jgi:hypothetical protein
MTERQASFKGNKGYLPSKPCLACQKEMSWRKSWAKNWSEIKYCSERCRKNSKNLAALKP